MGYVLLILGMFISFAPVARAQADESDWRLQATRTEAWSGQWVPEDSTFRAYDSAGRLDTFQRLRRVDGAWLLLQQTLPAYNTVGQETQSLDIDFAQDGTVRRRRRTLFSYDPLGQLQLVQNQLEVDGEWQTRVRVTYFYQEDGQVAVRNRETLDAGGQVDLQRSEFHYNERGLLTEEVERGLVGDSLVNQVRNRYTYDPAGRVVTFREEDWVDSAWAPRGLSTYAYLRTDTLAVDTVVLAQWLNGEWQPLLRELERVDPREERIFSGELQQGGGGQWFSVQREESTYDPVLRQQRIVYQQRINTWENVDQVIYTYDAEDLLTLATEQEWNGTGWENDDRTFYFYERVSLTTALTTPVLPGMRIYPNPVHDQLNIELSGPKATFTRARLYDLQGRLHLERILDPAGGVIAWPPALPSGTYVLEIVHGPARSSRLIQRY